MAGEDFVTRGDRNKDFLMWFGPMLRIFLRHHRELKRADLELMFYLHGLKFFTKKEFQRGKRIYTWDKNRWTRLRKLEYIIPTKDNKDVVRQRGEGYRYQLSRKANRIVENFYKCLIKRQDLVENIRNKTSLKNKNLTYSEKIALIVSKQLNRGII